MTTLSIATQTLALAPSGNSPLHDFIGCVANGSAAPLDYSLIATWDELQHEKNLHAQTLYWFVDLAVNTVSYRLDCATYNPAETEYFQVTPEATEAKLADTLSRLPYNLVAAAHAIARHLAMNPVDAASFFAQPTNLLAK